MTDPFRGDGAQGTGDTRVRPAGAAYERMRPRRGPRAEKPEPVSGARPGARSGPVVDPGRFAERPSSRYGPRRVHARPAKRRSRLRTVVGVVLALTVCPAAATYVWADTQLRRDVDLNAHGGRPPAGKGTNYLIVGSDSRDGLSGDEVKDLHVGGGGGRRTDSMILLHTGTHGSTMVSLPRDSWVTIPRHTDPATGKTPPPTHDKLNASFSYGGPDLLIRTIEYNTGLRIDHYAEIGFAGFVGIVNAVGGVPMCLDHAVKDEKSGADFGKGCHMLDGTQALAFVRQRHQEAQGDLGRTRNQQKFLSALAHRAARPRTLLDPTEILPALHAGLGSLIVDKGMSLPVLATMFRAVQGVSAGRGGQMNVPVSGVGIVTPKGSVVKWDAKRSARLFDELRNDRPVIVPKGSR
ncbi:LCP family protein [Streptomyces sp. NPDC001288]|uniref:LCP family protein n=1 Tax=Streptomyces sp. NPDC001297 TaxID=3364559 RepID=UPI0036865CFC